MPSLTRDFKRTTENVDRTPITIPFYDTNRAIHTVVGSISRIFYNDLKAMLQETTLTITFDDDNYSFTLFGVVFYVFCVETSGYGNPSYYSIIPVIYRKGDYNINTPFSRFVTNVSSSINNYGNERTNSICFYESRTEFAYRIRIHYNIDFLHITYGPKYSISYVLPLMCAIEGKTIENRKIVYLSGDCNTNYFTKIMTSSTPQFYYNAPKSPYGESQASPTTCALFHHIIFPDTPEINLFGNIRTNVNVYAIFDNIKETQYTKQYLLSDENKNKYLKRKPILLGNMAEFGNNILLAEKDMTIMSYYKIDDEDYYCPGTTWESDWSSNYNEYAENKRQLLLLKI